jgi:antitoxin component HigA of HigAB toxin-antitoxin module
MTDADYRAAMKAIEALMPRDPEEDSPLGEALDLLARACMDYEVEHFGDLRSRPKEN